jgi:Fe-S-cluster-containing dehydrogenase component
MRTIILTHFDLCTGCLICQLACSEVQTGGYNPRLAHLRVDFNADWNIHLPRVCAHCANAYCITVCPRKGAIGRDVSGRVLIDSDRCTGCGLCAAHCYLGMVRIDRHAGKAVKCDLCGGDPACVRHCPTGALEKIVAGG